MWQVIEVNSSTKRGGKYILSELLEATQSHQVSTKRSTQTELFSRANAAASEDKEKPQKEQTKRNKKKKGLPKKKEQLSEETQLQGPMSLILLDEVSLYFMSFLALQFNYCYNTWFVRIVIVFL